MEDFDRCTQNILAREQSPKTMSGCRRHKYKLDEDFKIESDTPIKRLADAAIMRINALLNRRRFEDGTVASF